MRGEANGEEEEQPRRNHLREDAEEEEEEEGQRAQRAARPVSGQQQQQRRRRPTDVGGGAAMRSVGYVGKHRLSAAIARLDQELQSLQDELNELETMEPASAACQEVITSTEGKSDPLLPVTIGPENASWERWFQRVRSSRSNKWWASKGSDFS
uniref:G protein gamma domain-containing protein n=1 Tax=Oryza glumipatula TaxID=40148 RepID=A0A0D9YM23_9ORYZ